MAKKDNEEKGSNVKKQKVIYYEDDYQDEMVLPETEDMPEIRVTYKPLNMIQTSQLTDKILEGSTVEKAAIATIEMLTRHIIKWNVRKPNGDLINHQDVDELKRMDSGVINKIARIIRKDKSSPAQDIESIRKELKNSSREQDSM